MASIAGDWGLDDDRVRRACMGDRTAQDMLFRCSSPYIVQLAMARLAGGRGALHLAEDIAQEAQVGLLKGLARIEPSVAGFKRYAHGVVKNLVANALHDKRRRRPVEEDRRLAGQSLSGIGSESSVIGRIAADQTGPSTQVVRADRMVRVLLAIGDLEDIDREIVILAFFEGMRTTEIAERLGGGATRGSVGMRITRALRRVSERLAREEGDDLAARSH